MDFSRFDERPIVVALAGPNGAGKTTFYHAHLAPAGLRFVNADVLAEELALGPYEAARIADAVRRELLKSGESFVFETVVSDPVGDKVAFLDEAARGGAIVVLCYIGIADPEQSTERVAMRVSQGGHDVPDDKLRTRFPRTLENLERAMRRLPHVLVFDNSDLATPFRQVALFDHGQLVELHEPVPAWLAGLIA
ncbi:MAG: AAA family ATPase [Gemmataceae bacterium]